MASCFVEIERSLRLPEEQPPIECYIIENVDPKRCGPLLRDLNAVMPLRRCSPTAAEAEAVSSSNDFPGACLPRTDHLKRIRRRTATAEEMMSRAISVKETRDGDNSNAADEGGTNEAEGNGRRPPRERAAGRSSDEGRGGKRRDDSPPWSLDVLVGSVAAVEWAEGTANGAPAPSLGSVLEGHNLSPTFVRKSLPGRPARTRDELGQWNRQLWPTLFFEEKTARYREDKLALSAGEIEAMLRGMGEALEDACACRCQWREWRGRDGPGVIADAGGVGGGPQIAGAVVMDSLLGAGGSIVSRSSEERRMQGAPPGGEGGSTERDDADSLGRTPGARTWSSFPDEANPLCTPVLLAIQGVSRGERRVARGSGMGSEDFRAGQYLCTGYDVFLTKEPTVYEAMALVHSRVRRVVFGVPDRGMGGLGGVYVGASDRRYAGVHSLPGTNHHYRAFRLDPGGSADGSCGEEAARLMGSLRELHADLL